MKHCDRKFDRPMLRFMYMHVYIGVDFGGQPGRVLPIIEKRLRAYAFIGYYQLCPPPNILVSPNVFDKSTPLHVYVYEPMRV